MLLLSRFWWAKLRGLAHIGDYEEMERFSRQKKSPIGYEVKKFNNRGYLGRPCISKQNVLAKKKAKCLSI